MNIDRANLNEALPAVPSPGRRLTLQGETVKAKVWFASIDEVFRLINPAQALAPAELAHARSFRLAADRDRFLAGRALLRYALTETMGAGVPVSSWRYREGSHGKPMMEAGLPALEFNLSHSGTCVVVSVSEDHPVGVNIESIAPEDCSEVVPDVLTERELNCLKLYDRDRQRVEFVRIWTVKEACAKALGFGGSMDFRGLEVDLDPLQSLKACSLLDAAQKFAVATMTVWWAGRPYCFSVVEIISEESQSR